MSEEKTLDELKAELESLKKMNLEREIAFEKSKVDEAKELVENKKAEELRETIRTELMQEMKGTSTVATSEPEKLSEKPKYEVYMDNMKEKYGLTGESYEKLTKRIASPGNYKGERK